MQNITKNIPQNKLGGITVAIVLTDGFEQIEMTGPRKALEQQGAITKIVSPKRDQVQGFHHDKPADRFDVDLTLADARADDFDAVLLPGGVQNADSIRSDERAQQFVQNIDRDGKPLAVICHGAWLLVSAKLVDGRSLTSWPSLQDDLLNAGAKWQDKQVVIDDNWVSSRKPDDIPAFNQAFIDALSQRTTSKASAVAQ